jgi:hypothetical protein
MPLIYQKRISRADLRANPEQIYVFGDNVQRKGLGGQAYEMRGEPNSFGIPTKWFPKMTPEAFFWDSQRDKIEPILDPLYLHLIRILKEGRTIVWPEDDIGTGMSRMNVYAPKIWAELRDIRINLLEKTLPQFPWKERTLS